MSFSSPSRTESSIGFYVTPLSSEESDSSFSAENQLSKVKFNYERKPKIDYTKLQLPKNVQPLCQMLDQLSIQNQGPPYPPSKIKLGPFSRATPSPIQGSPIPGSSSASYSANNDAYNGEEMLLFESPRKGVGLTKKKTKKYEAGMSSSKPVIKSPFKTRKL